MKICCTYCGREASLEIVNGFKTWRCVPCNARASCDQRAGTPIGTFANSRLIHMRKFVHKNFDPIWKDGVISRTEAYELLADALEIKKEDCHINLFDESRCELSIEKVQEIKFKLKGVGFLQ